LQSYVDSYILSSSHGETIYLKSQWPASNETSIVFYLADLPKHNSVPDTSNLQDKATCIVGLLSRCNGVVSFDGVYRTFIIQFKANGFHKIFGVPAATVANRIYHSADVFGKYAAALQEKLLNTTSTIEMALHADDFLLSFVRKQKHFQYSAPDAITAISNELFTLPMLLNVKQYAYRANMSVRTFERRFSEQVGIAPKFYCRLLRFNTAVNVKLKRPGKSWTSIAHECGYFDQMHMIKDFRQFASCNPTELLQQQQEYQPPPMDMTEKFILLER